MKTIAEMREILRGCPQCGRRRATDEDYARECEEPNDANDGCDAGFCWCRDVCWNGEYCPQTGGVSAHERVMSHVALLVDVAEAAERVVGDWPELRKALAALNAALESDS